MYRARDHFLSRSRFSLKQHCRSRWRHQFHLRQNPPDRRALPNDLFEIEGVADFFFQVQLLFREFFLQRVNFLERHGVFHRNGHLRRDLLHHFDVRIGERVQSAAREIQRTESAPAIRQRNAQDRLQTFRAQ